ncbi:hypothetical protein C2E25_06605 [Geothermobacter hydrogeniphilus]|uniref:Uncharacterized protein n=1 Tax=Geothermobacter hydrogeniphilus TaxID=1969733 RepID=A0A2K2HB63_9BACT|nr:right-handed parallel beta-helix repeat-containing protein [Geothermobacter hydrogeniphilus]PNU20542.1 hypothetical protein C2E25_06605 [Geothermobacter hydrogeniphilus]
MRILLLIGLLWPTLLSAMTLDGETRWQGAMTIREPVRVASGATLRIEPGARITFAGGGLTVSGRLIARQCELSGKNWSGIVLKGVGADTLLADCRISGAATGVLVESGEPRLEGLTLEGNRIGIELRRKSAATVTGCLLRDNSRVGLFVKDGTTAAVVNNRFEKNGRFGAYLYKAQPRRFTGNVFTGNPTGLMVSHYGSNPRLVENSLTGNGTAVLVDRAARPVLRRNDIRDNEIGVRCYRRSDPLLEKNRISGNRTGVSIAYSSYPRLRGNDLSGNGTALFLEYQSAQWEREKGAAAREQEVSRSAFGGRPRQEVGEAERRPRKLDGTIDARGNWWGDAATAELGRIGDDGNPSFIDDGRDRPNFEEGGRNWPLDRVRFAPWLHEAVR